MTKIINLSLSTGIFPDEFKTTTVVPLLKKSNLNKDDLSNYRPISHLSFLSKLTEKVVKSRLTDFLSANHLLNTFQSAYTKSHSTETTLLAVHDHIIKAMGKKQVTALCLLDLSSAFDTIDHTILLQRLSSWFGINGIALSWIKSYLTSRSFKVNVNGSLSSVFPVLFGVPQGSVLGPLLFTLYTTPLSSLISASPVSHHLYADDTQLFISFSTDNFEINIRCLENTLSKVSSWMASNFLSLNPSKTEFLLIGLPTQLSKISDAVLHLSSETTVSPIPAARNLGVIFDSNMSMSDHISTLSKISLSQIRDIRRIRSNLDHNTARTIVTSLIHSRLDYCNSLFLNLPVSQLKRLQFILNASARAVTRTPKFSHISPVLKSLHWLKINERIHFKVLSLTYKVLQTNQPIYLRKLLTVQPASNTRSSSVVTLVRCSTTRLHVNDRSFSYYAPILWNSLPKEFRQPAAHSFDATCFHPVLALSSSEFHSKLKTFLFTHSYPP